MLATNLNILLNLVQGFFPYISAGNNLTLNTAWKWYLTRLKQRQYGHWKENSNLPEMISITDKTK